MSGAVDDDETSVPTHIIDKKFLPIVRYIIEIGVLFNSSAGRKTLKR
jgi:hypothetical protein